MATWQQVKSYIYANYKVSDDNGTMLTLLFDTGNGRSQMIFVAHLEAGEMSSLQFSSPFGQWSKVSADRVLRATERHAVGIKSIGDFFAVTHTQLLASIDEAEIDWPLLFLAKSADDLERELGQGDAF